MTKRKDKFKPIPHTYKDDEKLFTNTEFKKAWDALEGKYADLSKLFRSHQQTKDL